MAKRLTEEMVIARSKLSDLSKVKRLNCWGSELVDVSLLRKMPSVEVLSLSINKINSLCDFQYCGALQELYIRQNDIRDLNQICYLQGLPNLKNLWLGENPCATGEGYRMAVLRTLPQLQKLDNVSVTQDELREATRKGRGLSHPEDPQDSEEEYIPQGQYQRYQEYPAENEYSPQQSPSTNEPSPPRRMEAVRGNYSPEQEYSDRRSNNYEQEYQPRQTAQYYEQKSPTNNNSADEGGDGTYRDMKLVSSQSTNSIKDYTNGEKYHPQNNYRQNEGSEISNQSHEAANRRERYNCPASHQPPFNRRPVTRNSNILSAVLCLVKELDYPSLEVVEMAVRCRMDELEE
ncbi:cilia- and flagella-associated protein 410 isoform X3 [Photinus pyralis]|uniref:U2A'/phosphoprotein 32 family A C-terminal domain-containing protein n=1 Tax=Photinus pyralis TaxID=7054 RepID=A0A1Y1N761_PHOPY|nr:cilia- and flagella-associated protein 410 isoform X3 [Photinus pyralis]